MGNLLSWLEVARREAQKKRPQGAVYWSLGNKKLILNYMGERLRTRKNPDFSLSPIRSHLRYTTGLLNV
jgi:hypothetical protein